MCDIAIQFVMRFYFCGHQFQYVLISSPSDNSQETKRLDSNTLKIWIKFYAFCNILTDTINSFAIFMCRRGRTNLLTGTHGYVASFQAKLRA